MMITAHDGYIYSDIPYMVVNNDGNYGDHDARDDDDEEDP